MADDRKLLPTTPECSPANGGAGVLPGVCRETCARAAYANKYTSDRWYIWPQTYAQSLQCVRNLPERLEACTLRRRRALDASESRSGDNARLRATAIISRSSIIRPPNRGENNSLARLGVTVTTSSMYTRRARASCFPPWYPIRFWAVRHQSSSGNLTADTAVYQRL